MKLGLATRGKWTSEHDVSQDVYIYMYFLVNTHTHTHTHTHIIAKVKFQNLISLSMLYTYLNFIIYCMLL